MLLIGILAAIAIPSFLGQTLTAKDAAAKSDVRRLASMVHECRLDKSSYKDCNSDNELDGTPGLDWGNGAGEVRVLGANDDDFEAEAKSHSRTGSHNHVFSVIRNANGSWDRHCTPAGAGACPTTRSGSQAAAPRAAAARASTMRGRSPNGIASSVSAPARS